ncbi:MAG: alpha/beta fold hydrolase [Myxococcales bacterium]|nr:alpha/beta fold hydrolase [Myxococcales bacterium]
MTLPAIVADGLRARRAEAPPVVLVHGASGRADTWRPVLPAWSWADVWAPSLPGRDGSATIGHRDVGALASWLVEAVCAMPPKPWLVGHSLGGAVALTVALRRPDTIAGLVLVSSGARLKVAPPILELARATTPEQPLPLGFAFGPDAPEPLRHDYHARSHGVPTETTVGDWLACDGFDERARLAEVGHACLVLWGDQDTLTPPKFQQKLVAGLPRAEGRELPGFGHMLPWEAPQEVSEAVQAFVGRQLSPT